MENTGPGGTSGYPDRAGAPRLRTEHLRTQCNGGYRKRGMQHAALAAGLHRQTGQGGPPKDRWGRPISNYDVQDLSNFFNLLL